MTDWANDLSEDYHVAAVRLVTLTENRVQHLLFASIELYPNEIPPPPQNIEPKGKISAKQLSGSILLLCRSGTP
jgi:hypothetical protein